MRLRSSVAVAVLVVLCIGESFAELPERRTKVSIVGEAFHVGRG
jgi:hypothetical protein